MEERMGALIGQGQFDWHALANGAANRKVILESGNWRELTVPNEIQIVGYGTDKQYDTSMCVTFNGATDGLEYLLMQMIRTNLIPAESVKWLKDKGYFENGVINFNERFSATKGDTTIYGAYQYKVANAIKNFGLIPQKLFPYADNFKDNIDPKFITEEMNKLGKEFLEHFAINYEWVNDEDTAEFLKYSPLSCVGQYADGDGILNPPTNNGHCMLLVNETSEYREIDDSYWRQYKKYKKDKLQSFMAWYITPLKTNNMDTAKWLKENDKKFVRNFNTGQFGRCLQNKLMVVEAKDRGALLLLDDKVRENGVQISNEDWTTLPKNNF